MVSWDPDGAGPAQPLVATGGEFADASGVTVNNIAAFDVATRTWIPLGSGTNGRVNAVLALPNGNLLIGGAFSSAGGVACNNLAEWNGATWSAFASGTNNEVFALLMLANGDIVVGGAFTMAGTVPCNRIAKWNWSTWSSYGSGMDGSVRSLAAWSNGNLVVGGTFTTAGGTAACGLSRWNGSYWVTYGACWSGFQGASDVAVLPNGEFLTLQFGVMMQWSLATLSWVTLTPQPGAAVNAFQVLENGHLVAVGQLGATPTQTTLMWEWDGFSWASTTYARGRFWARCVTEVPGFGLAIGGSVSSPYGEYSSAALWSGSVWTPMGNGFDAPVSAVLELSDGDLLVAGEFSAFGDQTGLDRIARWDGQAWSPMGAMPTGTTCLAQLPNGDLLAGGGNPCLWRWNGSTWSPISSTSGRIKKILGTPNGDVFAAGVINTQPYNSAIARWDGVAWTPVQYMLTSAMPPSIESRGNEVWYAYASTVYRWNGVGGTVLGTCDNWVRALQVLPNGDLIAGGDFNTINSQPMRKVARWDGSSWSPLGPGLNNVVNILGKLADGDLLAGGFFTSAVGGGGGAHFTRWDGSTWTDLDGFGAEPTGIVARKNGDLLLVGPFKQAGNLSSYVERWTPGCPAASTPNGASCAGSGGLNVLSATSLAWTGASLALQATGMPQNGICALVSGFQTTATPLNTLLPQGRPGCDLMVSTELGLRLGTPSGGALGFSYAIANVPALTGITFRQQVLTMEFDLQGGIVDLTGTNAITHTIGRL
jgi:hypothetical protein